jgi:hypothetical protein
MTTQHTPGPGRVIPHSAGAGFYVTWGDRVVASGLREDDGRLIAAAPEMREILDAVAHDPKNQHQGIALALLARIDGEKS